MKRTLAVLLVLVMIMTVACKSADKTDNSPTTTVEDKPATQAPTEEPTTEPTSEPTAEPTAGITPEPTEEPAPTDVPDKADEKGNDDDNGYTDVKDLYSDNYENFAGTWYLDRGEVDGYAWTAAEEGEFIQVSFNVDLSARYVREIPDSDSVIYEGPCVYYRDENGKAYVDVAFNNESCEYCYSINENGELVEDCLISYGDGTTASAENIYTHTAPSLTDDDSVARTVPDTILEYINAATESEWLVTIADPSPELSAACDEAGWELHDETDNEWVNCPWNNPKELIIANSTNRPVEIEIHEPRSGYDPSSSETEWEAGPFMYWAYLEPGEICRFIVDMPDEKKDATMCMYMTFGDDEFDYYLRVFKYDIEDPYVIF